MIAGTHARQILDSRGYPMEVVRGGIARALRGYDRCDQVAVDHLLVPVDGTHDKSRLGANAMLATSLAVGRATAAETGMQAGARSRERVAKYNRLLRIEEALGPDARFAGLSAFYPDKWGASA